MTKTMGKNKFIEVAFESYVISYMTKTFIIIVNIFALFESYVISYMTKTQPKANK